MARSVRRMRPHQLRPVYPRGVPARAPYGSSTWDNGGSLTSWVRKDDACDASSAPLFGSVGDCTDTLMSGQTCTPTCEAGYRLIGGVWSCHNRQLYRPSLNDVCHSIYGLPVDSIPPAPKINTNVTFPEDIGDCEAIARVRSAKETTYAERSVCAQSRRLSAAGRVRDVKWSLT